METIYRKVYTKDRLPEKEGVYYVEMNKGCCGLREIHFWGHYHNRKDGKAQVRYWQNTFDWWLEEVELPSEEEIELDRPYKAPISNEQLFKNIGFIRGARYLIEFITGKA